MHTGECDVRGDDIGGIAVHIGGIAVHIGARVSALAGANDVLCRCHRGEDHSWIAERPPALVTDARTGYANPGCDGRASNDCSEDLTLEHYISGDRLESIAWDGKAVMVSLRRHKPAAQTQPVDKNAIGDNPRQAG